MNKEISVYDKDLLVGTVEVLAEDGPDLISVMACESPDGAPVYVMYVAGMNYGILISPAVFNHIQGAQNGV